MSRNSKINGVNCNHNQNASPTCSLSRPDLDELVRTVGEAMPDSFRRRRRVLRGLIAHLPKEYPLRDEIAALLVSLELHELSCRELPQLAQQPIAFRACASKQ